MDGTFAMDLTRHLNINYNVYKEELCTYVHALNKTDQCEWVRNSEQCQANGGYINYLNFIFCTLSSFPTAVQFAILLLWIVFLFILLGTIADNFFCPALTVLAKLLHLSESIAGVTILAFGNGSSDIFTGLAGLSSGHSQLIFSNVIGGGIFVTTVVVGLICIFYPFEINGGHFLRDSICYLCAVFWTFFIFWSGYIGVMGTAGFLLLYVVYITIVLFTRKLKKDKTLREIKPMKSFVATSSAANSVVMIRTDDDTQTTVPASLSTQPGNEEQESAEEDAKQIKEIFRMSPTGSLEGHGDDSTAMLNPQPSPNVSASLRETPLRLGSTGFHTVEDLAIQAEHIRRLSIRNEAVLIGKELSRRLAVENFLEFNRPQGLFTSLWYEINPLLIEGWSHKACHMKFIAILQAPVLLLLKLLIPVVNLTSLNHGWCKLLNVIQCTTTPLVCVLVTGVARQPFIYEICIWTTVSVIGVCLSITVFFTSKSNKVPIYHDVFSILGFVGSVLVIYLVAQETVNVLRAFGIMMRISEGTLGLTILAWGNSLGDLVSNLSIAKAGYQKMGFAACFGAPLFGTLLGLGVASVFGMIKKIDSIKVDYGNLGPTCTLFLVLSLVSSIIVLPLLRFQGRQSYGFYLISLYLMFAITIILSELNVIRAL